MPVPGHLHVARSAAGIVFVFLGSCMFFRVGQNKHTKNKALKMIFSILSCLPKESQCWECSSTLLYPLILLKLHYESHGESLAFIVSGSAWISFQQTPPNHFEKPYLVEFGLPPLRLELSQGVRRRGWGAL